MWWEVFKNNLFEIAGVIIFGFVVWVIGSWFYNIGVEAWERYHKDRFKL